jgi:hypothetical protein
MSRALSKEMMTICFGLAGLKAEGGSARAPFSAASDAHENTMARNSMGTQNRLGMNKGLLM